MLRVGGEGRWGKQVGKAGGKGRSQRQLMMVRRLVMTDGKGKRAGRWRGKGSNQMIKAAHKCWRKLTSRQVVQHAISLMMVRLRQARGKNIGASTDPLILDVFQRLQVIAAGQSKGCTAKRVQWLDLILVDEGHQRHQPKTALHSITCRAC